MLDKGLAINPKEFFLRMYQGVLYAITGRRKEALESLAEIQLDKFEGNRLWGRSSYRLHSGTSMRRSKPSGGRLK
jgi:hypothetical protein